MTTIEEKRPAPAAADRALVKALRGRRGQVTLADAVTASGLPTHVVEPALERLLGRFRSHLAVTESGELLYAFDPAFHRRDEPTRAERLAAAGRFLTSLAVRAFKALIAIVLVVYVVVFVVLLVGALLAGRRDDRRDGGWGGGGWDRGHDGWGRGHGHGGGGLGWMMWWWWFFPPRWGWGGARTDSWGRTLPAPAPDRRRARGSRKPFVQMVYDFVFGPATTPSDPLADEREALAYLRAHDGRVTATELVALFGWSYHQAEEQATRLLVDYDGEPEITEEGVLVYAFPKLLRSAETQVEASARASATAPASGAPWRYAWERIETPGPLTGNGGGANALIAGFAAFNLLAATRAADWASVAYGLSGPAWDFVLGPFPFAFFALFLLVPVARAAARRLGAPARARRNRARLLVRDVVAARGAPLADAPGMREVALALEGEPDLDEASGDAVWRFPRVAEETAARERHLAGVDLAAERELGPVIFGSEEEAEAEAEAGEARSARDELPRLPPR